MVYQIGLCSVQFVIILTLYFTWVMAFFLFTQNIDFAALTAFGSPAMKIAGTLAVLSTVAHAWIGSDHWYGLSAACACGAVRHMVRCLSGSVFTGAICLPRVGNAIGLAVLRIDL